VDAGVETFESCEGGDGQAFTEPTVRFHGALGAGFRALSVCLDYGLPVLALHRTWYMIRNEPTGPKWEITFRERLCYVPRAIHALQRSRLPSPATRSFASISFP